LQQIKAHQHKEKEKLKHCDYEVQSAMASFHG
jgi:hypothetical protein